MRWIAVLTFGVASLSFGHDRTPSPDLSPKDVVKIVLESMADNDNPLPDAGIRQAFRFASPSNKRSTGPFWHFKAIVERPAYAPLIDHTSRTLGDPEYADNDTVSIPVMVIAPSGEIAGYLWSLSKQTSGKNRGSWMTDSVMRVPLGPKTNAL